ncbi:uncharacterized protein LOC134249701 [Saccostrea cucullata]|uniref:uncharacterized protein LOC134249701 n=1 Tax=Saccostrea cuccullata TaxID=36930 RepID=UPI002ED60E5E
MTDKISVSWSGFEADMGIDHFEVGISSRPPLYPNGTHDCYTFRDFDEVFNTKKMEGVGKDTFKDLKQLSLLHGHSYFVTVIAADVTGKCVGSTGKAVIIDTSPPEKGNVTIRGKYSDNIVYIKHYDQITIEWNGFQDNESGILEYEIKLYSSTTCYDDGSDPEKNTDIHTPEKAVTVKTENKITFYELSLKQFKTYIVKVTAKSKAGLQTSSLSEYIKCDTTPPTKGTVKVGDSWFKEAAFQPFTDKLNGTIALAHSEMAYQCQSQRPLDAQNELEPMKGRFRTECVITSDSKVKIEIRHDDNLRGIIKGGVKSIKKEIIAGNYSSKLTTARGKQMVTSIFLATGSQFVKEELDFQVKENQTDIDYDLNNTLSDSFSNITNFETSNMEMLNDSKMLNKSTVNSGMSKNINHTSNVEKSSVLGLNDIFGIGFHIPGYTKDKQWFVFVWVFDQYISTSRQIPIDFDPTVSNVEYTIQLTNSTFVGKNVWNVKYFIQSEQIAEFNGLRFEEYGTFGVYNWNENEYVPPIENIDFPVAFEASSTIEIMKEPIPADKPCMFGSSFFEKDSFIQEFWVKVSEYENETDTSFDDYLLYASFCQKCTENCNIGCRQDCKPSMTEFEILQFTIENLNLTASKMSGDRTNGSAVQYDSTTYFIHTLIVNSAGITTHSASKGVIIDNTPPEFNYVRCVDPLSSTEEPSLYQGSNDSLRAYWDCKEDVGQIVDYKIDAGTSPENNDILSDLPVGKGRKFLYSNLKTPLEHGKTYYITVRAVNSAGMVGKGSCNIIVELSPPNVENLIVQNMFTQDDEETFDVSLSTNEIGLQWQNGTNDVEFYEWQIGSEKDTDDIFPRIKVGLADSKKASIQNGELLIDDISLNATVGVFASKNKTNQKDVPNQSFFNMEPGLCLHIKLFAVGRSHLSSSVNPKPTCVIRDKDEQIDFTKTTKETLKDPVTLMPALSFTGKDNVILAGMLSKSDVMRDYGTAASDRYKRYIVDPTDTQNNTERILQKRFIGNTEHMFYLSPITNIETKFILDLPFNHHKYDVNQERPLLIFWNKENEKWEDVETNCETSSVIDYQTGTMTIEVCGDIFLVDKRHEGRQKRSTAEKGIMQSPRMFALRKVSKTVPNNPPFITTTEMQYKEDETSSELIKMGDPENDSLSIRLTMPPKHGSANLTSNGVLTYLSHRDFYGDDVITVRVREVNVTSPLTPLEIEKNITIRVLPQNDEPILSFKQRYHEMKCTKNNITLEVLLNGNETRHIFYGILILDDIDSNNTVHLGTMHNNTPNNHFVLEQQRHNVANFGHNGVHREYSIKQDIHKSFSGIAEFAARAHDEFDGGKVSFSKEFRISTYILINPCIHGICANKSNVPCKDKSRAFSFENFRCDCYPGYRGDWCQVDINECVPNPCSVFYDCNNLIGRYECILNGPKSFGLAIGFTVIVATLVLLIRRCIQKRPLNNKIAPINIWDENMTRENSEPKDFPLDTLTAELSTAQPANSVATETKNKRLFFKRLGTKGHEVKGGSGSLHEIENDQDFNIDENQLSRRTVLSEEQIQAMLTPLSYYSSAVGKSLPPHLQRGRMEERMSHDGPKSSQA